MAKRSNPAFAGFLAKAHAGGTVIEYGEAKIKVRNMSVGESQRLDKIRKAAEGKDGDPDAFTEELISVFIRYACDPETGEPFATEADRDEVRDNVPSGLIFRVFQAAATPDIKAAVKN